MPKKKKDRKEIIIEKEKEILKDDEPLLDEEKDGEEEEEEEEDIEKEENDEKAEEVEDISEMENNVVEDEDGNIIVETPHIDEEDELKEFVEDATEDKDTEGNSHIEKTKNIEEKDGKIKVSKTEYERVVNRLQTLKTASRKEVAEKLRTARGFGDLSENAEYEAAKKDQAFVEGEISDLEQRMERMEIIDLGGLTDEVAHIGNIVEIKRLSDKKIFNFLVVGSSYESDINCEPLRIATDSPIGNAVLGLAPGATTRVRLPHNKMATFTVLSVKH